MVCFASTRRRAITLRMLEFGTSVCGAVIAIGAVGLARRWRGGRAWPQARRGGRLGATQRGLDIHLDDAPVRPAALQCREVDPRLQRHAARQGRNENPVAHRIVPIALRDGRCRSGCCRRGGTSRRGRWARRPALQRRTAAAAVRQPGPVPPAPRQQSAQTRAPPRPARPARAIGSFTFTPAVPSATRILPSTPSSTASTSIVALSVSISAITSPALTVLAFLLQPARQRALGHRGRQRRHQDVGGHVRAPAQMIFFTASTTQSGCGSASFSRFAA